MSEEETKAVTERWFSALNSGDRAAALACLDENIRWINSPAEDGKPGGIPGLSAIIPWLGDFRNKADVVHSFDVWASLSEVLKHEDLDMMIRGNQALAIVHEVARIRRTGLVYEIEFVQRIRVENNAIVMLRAYWDTSRGIVAFRGDLAARLLKAAASGDTLEAELVLPFGANPNQTDPSGSESVLMIAAKSGHTEIIKLLLSHGAEPNLISRRSGYSALHIACLAGRKESVLALVEADAFVDIQCPKKGNTPLHDALLGGFDGCADVLVDAGARLDLAGYDGRRPLDIARAVLGESHPIVSKIAPGTTR